MKTGQVIKELRTERMKETQCVFAKAIGITQTYLSQIENGSKYPSKKVIRSISEHTGVISEVMIFMALEESDVIESKRCMFNRLKPSIDALIESINYEQ